MPNLKRNTQNNITGYLPFELEASQKGEYFMIQKYTSVSSMKENYHLILLFFMSFTISFLCLLYFFNGPTTDPDAGNSYCHGIGAHMTYKAPGNCVLEDGSR